jgi:NADPH:quinone reductase-like Zn-dependent oxidoreductase
MSITTHNAAGVLDTPLVLPSGATIKNRLVKAATQWHQHPTPPAQLTAMRAYLVNKYKRPMEAGEAPEPVVGARDALVEVHAAGVNLLDAKIRDGEFKVFLPYKAPFILGHDVAGVVSRIGSGVTRVSVGDEIYARVRDGRVGTFAERIAVHEDDLAIKPASLSMAEAASVPLVALTAWQALVTKANLRRGQKALIHAGSGGVGTYAIQLAKHLGATVATTTGTGNVDWVRELGVDTVIDYRTQDFEAVIHDYDVVLDSQSGDTLAKSLRVLKPGGIAIGIAGPPDPDFARQLGKRFPLMPVMALLSLKTRRSARRLGVRYSFLFMRASGAELDEITKLIDSGDLRPIVDRTYPFDEARQALAHVERGRSKGKVVITMR